MNTPAKELYEFGALPNAKKSDKEYGRKIAEKLFEEIKKGEYFSKRNARSILNRRFASGTQPMDEYLAMMNINADEAFLKLDLTPPAIAPKFMEILLERYMEREERPTVRAVDKISKKEKKQREDEAEFRMNMAPVIGDLQQQAGLPLEDPQAYTPEDYDDLILHFELEDRLPQEIGFERAIKDVIDDSDPDTLKRKSLEDGATDGIMVARVYLDANGNIKFKWIPTEDFVHGQSKFEDFRDVAWAGEYVKMKVTEAREMYPTLPESDIYDLYHASCQENKTSPLRWESSYESCLIRPYDDAIIEIFEFEIITNISKNWVTKVDRYGKMVIDEKKERPENLSDKKQLIEKPIRVVYRGCYAPGNRKMISWELCENMIKPHQALHEVFMSYCIVMPGNRNMQNMPLIQRVETAIRQMTLAHLKIQQLQATMKPDGWMIDIAGIADIDLGLGKFHTPMEVVAIHDQTGRLFYKRTDDDGETRKDPPILPMSDGGNLQKIQAEIEIYNFYQNMLRDSLGTNEYVEGQTVNPKTGLGVQQSQIESSNRATNFLYRGFITLMNQIAKRVAVLMWYKVVYGKETYGDSVSKDEVKDRVFDINVSMLPTDKEREFLESMLEKSITSGAIGTAASFKVRRIAKENVKLAEVYLEKCETKKMRDDMAIAAANTKNTTDSQIQSAQATHQMNMELENLQAQSKTQVAKMSGESSINQTLGAFATQMVLKSFELGKELPPYLAPLLERYFENVMGSQQLQSVDNNMEMQAIQQQLQQGQQQQA